MKNQKLTHNLNILKVLYDTDMRLTASQLHISNANQNFIDLEEMKLIKRVEVPRVGKSPFKVGYVDDDTREKAEQYLNKYNMKNSNTPLHIVSSNYVEDSEIGMGN